MFMDLCKEKTLISYLIKTLEMAENQFLENQIILMILYILMSVRSAIEKAIIKPKISMILI